MWSERSQQIAESLTLKLNSMVGTMKAAGETVFNLTAGEPDFPVPETAKKAAIQAIEENKSKYTPVAGEKIVLQAVANYMNRHQPTLAQKNPWTEKNIVLSNGAKQSLYNAFLILVNRGDEVLIPSPYWLTYPDSVMLVEGKPIFLNTRIEGKFKLNPEQLEKAITPKSKILILNSPGNPTGTVYSKKELRALGEVILKSGNKNLWVVSDEIYSEIVYKEAVFTSFLEAVPELRDRTITLNGMSKSCAMTGWRIGWSCASSEATEQIVKIQGHTTSGINSVAQWATLAGLKLGAETFSPMVSEYQNRRDHVLEILKKSGKIKVCAPEGAFYIFIGIGAKLRPGEDSIGFSERLLKEKKVAVVPGTPFGEPKSVRLSFATDKATLQEGCTRLVNFMEEN